jgi:hypothetical protein
VATVVLIWRGNSTDNFTFFTLTPLCRCISTPIHAILTTFQRHFKRIPGRCGGFMHRGRVAVSRLQTQVDPLGDSGQVPTRCRGRNLPGAWSPHRLSDDENGGGYAGHTRCARFWQGPSHAVSTRFNAFPTPFQRLSNAINAIRTPFQRHSNATLKHHSHSV